MSELNDFENQLKKELRRFETSRSPVRVKERKPPVRVAKQPKGLEVVLCVRNKKNSFLDERFTTLVEGTISQLEARIVAERRAREAGWKHIAYLVYCRTV